MEGSVKWFNTRKGYGFIKGDDGEEYFVHHSALPQGVFLRDNDRVSFEPADTEKGKQAQNVQLLQKGSELAAEEAPEEGKKGKKAKEEEAPVEEGEESENF